MSICMPLNQLIIINAGTMLLYRCSCTWRLIVWTINLLGKMSCNRDMVMVKQWICYLYLGRLYLGLTEICRWLNITFSIRFSFSESTCPPVPLMTNSTIVNLITDTDRWTVNVTCDEGYRFPSGLRWRIIHCNRSVGSWVYNATERCTSTYH